LQHVTPQETKLVTHFAVHFSSRLEHDELFTAKIVFSDEATFLLQGNVNRHDLRLWGRNNPHEVTEHMRDSPKLNVFCALSKQKVFETLSFDESSEPGTVYLDMLDESLMPILEEGGPEDILSHKEMTEFLNRKFPGKWTSRGRAIT
jgi:hypothetical protein